MENHYKRILPIKKERNILIKKDKRENKGDLILIHILQAQIVRAGIRIKRNKKRLINLIILILLSKIL